MHTVGQPPYTCTKCNKQIQEFYHTAYQTNNKIRVYYCSKRCNAKFSQAYPFKRSDSTDDLADSAGAQTTRKIVQVRTAIVSSEAVRVATTDQLDRDEAARVGTYVVDMPPNQTNSVPEALPRTCSKKVCDCLKKLWCC